MAVTAPQAAIPPATNELVAEINQFLSHDLGFEGSPYGRRHGARRRQEEQSPMPSGTAEFKDLLRSDSFCVSCSPM